MELISEAATKHPQKLSLWEQFCGRYQIAQSGVPLFTHHNLQVEVFPFGKDERFVLRRSVEMEEQIVQQSYLVLQDFKRNLERYNGLIYMMFWKRCFKGKEMVIPLYIGRTGKYGKKGDNLSANIKGIGYLEEKEGTKNFGQRKSMTPAKPFGKGKRLTVMNGDKFARWGYAYDYHIGSLSAVTCLGHPISKQHQKYRRWAQQLFEKVPAENPLLKEEVFFWVKAWSQEKIGIWEEFGATNLSFLEYLLIGVASTLFPKAVLNSEGANFMESFISK